MVLTDFTKLLKSEYFVYDEEKNEEVLLDGAPPGVIELYKEYKEILEEEKQTGAAIF
jgi:hypothetical protein